MNTRILLAAMASSFVPLTVFGQMNTYAPPQSQPPTQVSRGDMQTQPTKKTTTTTPTGVKGYLDSQIAGSKDRKFHVSLNGKDLALTPVRLGEEKKLGGGKGAMPVDMKGADGKIYEIDFVTSGGQVTGAKVGKINGKAP